MEDRSQGASDGDAVSVGRRGLGTTMDARSQPSELAPIALALTRKNVVEVE